MGLAKYIALILILSITLTSCGLLGINHFFDRGYYNKNNQYVPKHPHFRLKDKKRNKIPPNLDTVNIYKRNLMIVKGKDYMQDDEHKAAHYYKFSSNGRYIDIIFVTKNTLGESNVLQESNLDPNSSMSSKNYYYSKDGTTIQTEGFIPGTGYGMYSRSSFILSKEGDTIIYDDKKGSRITYVKEIIPTEWKKYPVDW